MYGQMKKYKESLKSTPGPIMLSQIPMKIDLRGIIAYAKEKGVQPAMLSEEEKQRFVIKSE